APMIRPRIATIAARRPPGSCSRGTPIEPLAIEIDEGCLDGSPSRDDERADGIAAPEPVEGGREGAVERAPPYAGAFGVVSGSTSASPGAAPPPAAALAPSTDMT